MESRVFRRVTLPGPVRTDSRRLRRTATAAAGAVLSTVRVDPHLIQRCPASPRRFLINHASTCTRTQQDYMQCPGASCPEIIPTVVACTSWNRGKFFCGVRLVSTEKLLVRQMRVFCVCSPCVCLSELQASFEGFGNSPGPQVRPSTPCLRQLKSAPPLRVYLARQEILWAPK